MKKIINPYQKLQGYNCFGCSQTNSSGLRMSFYEDGEFIVSKWKPRDSFQGYINILHGGIQATLMDEIASWLVQIKLKTSGVTAKMETRYIKSVFMDKGDILLKAKLLENRKRLARVHVELFDSENNLCTESYISYFIFPHKIAKKEFNYPEHKEFFER